MELLKIGKDDIVIVKQENKTNCYCKESSYDLQGNKNLLLSNSRENEVKFKIGC